jgi:hypothetical protein
MEGSEMHVSLYYTRGMILLALSFFVPDGVEYYVNGHKPEFPDGAVPGLNAALLLYFVLFVILAIGQFQHAYYFMRMGDVLKKVLEEKKSYAFVTLNGDDAMATKYHDGFRVEVVPHDSFDVTVYIMRRRTIHAHKQVLIGLAERVTSDGSFDATSVLKESVVLSLDYKSELKALVTAMESRSSR